MKTIFSIFISLLIALSSFSQTKEEIQLQLIAFFEKFEGSDRKDKDCTTYRLEFNDSLMTVHINKLEYVKDVNFGNMHSEWNLNFIILIKRLQYVKFITKENRNYLKFKVFPGEEEELIKSYNFRYKYIEEKEIYVNPHNLNDSIKKEIENRFKELITLYCSEKTND